MHPKQLAAVFALPPEKRFGHFIGMVADREKAWGLYQDGWALACTDDGTRVFPLWPAQEYAQACALDTWAGYAPREIPLGDLMEKLLPGLKSDGILPGILPTPAGKGAMPPADDVMAALEEELRRY